MATRARSAAARAAATDAAGGGPEDPVADAAAAAQLVRGARRGSAPPSAFDRLPDGGQSGGAGVGIRLIWAVAAGLLVLEVLSLATGRYWSWDLRGGLASLRNSGSYLGLYPGQLAKLATPEPSATSAMPGVLPSTVGNTAPQAGLVIGPTP